MASEEEVRGLAELAAERNVVLVSDEIYNAFCYDGAVRLAGPIQCADAGGGRIQQDLRDARVAFGIRPRPRGDHPGDAQAPAVQFRLRAAPFSVGGGGGHGRGPERPDRRLPPQTGLDRRGLAGDYELVRPGGAFYAFPKAPWGTGTEFVTRAIEEHQLLIIPGSVFSRRDTHFRLSYAAPDAVIQRGIAALRRLARR